MAHKNSNNQLGKPTVEQVKARLREEHGITVSDDFDLTPPPELVRKIQEMEDSIQPTKADLKRKW